METVRWFEELVAEDAGEVGGKNASLGEMIRALRDEGARIPEGFAVTTSAYWRFLAAGGLDRHISALVQQMKAGDATIRNSGAAIRELFLTQDLPQDVAEAIISAYRDLGRRCGQRNVAVAVRSSLALESDAVAVGLGTNPQPSEWAVTQQHTFLDVQGEENVLDACLKCYASVFSDRAIASREEKGLDYLRVALSIGVQRMVRADSAGSGVARAWDPDSGFPNVVVIDAAWGLGEGVASAAVSAHHYVVFKPLLDESGVEPIIDRHMASKKTKLVHGETAERPTRVVETSEEERRTFVLTDREVLRLARWACDVEAHYGKLMEIEWAKDGDSGELFILQARSKAPVQAAGSGTFHTYRVKEPGERILSGLGIGEGLVTGKAFVIRRLDEAERFPERGILVASSTDPDWAPVIKRAAGLVTDFGGRTSDGANAAKDLGIPAIVGTGEATRTIRSGQEVTLSCTEGEEGYVYAGALEFEEVAIGLQDMPETCTRVMLSVASHASAFRWWRLPARGIGLAATEFIMANAIKVHPMALARFKELSDLDARRRIAALAWPHEDKAEYFMSHLAHGVAKMGAAQYPEPVFVRFSDFNSTQYGALVGGKQFEPKENNPLLGLRGASRYYRALYRDGFALECKAIRRAREELGLLNIGVVIPFVRTPTEARRVLQVMAQNGLQRGSEGLLVYMMCQLPSNALLAADFARQVDGFVIAADDLAHAVLGIDLEEAALADLHDPSGDAVKGLVRPIVAAARQAGITVGVVGEALSANSDFTAYLVELGVDFLAIAPEHLIAVKQRVHAEERRLGIEQPRG